MLIERSFVTLDDLASRVADGAMLGLPKDESGAPTAAVRALVKRKVAGLHLLCVPACGYHADLLIGAGCVAIVECGGIVVGEFGPGPRFQAAVRLGQIRLKDSTCPVIHAGLQAGAKGSPFASVRGILGSDLVKVRPEWRVIDNPFSNGGDPVLLVPALNPDVFMFHARWGDRFGNVWTGGRRELSYTAHAAKQTLVTIEQIWDGNLLEDPVMAAGTLSEVYVSAVSHVPKGTWPMSLQHVRTEDVEHIRSYYAAARNDDSFRAYLAEQMKDAAINGVSA